MFYCVDGSFDENLFGELPVKMDEHLWFMFQPVAGQTKIIYQEFEYTPITCYDNYLDIIGAFGPSNYSFFNFGQTKESSGFQKVSVGELNLNVYI